MNRNDQRITAYALGELHGPEREAFEAELAGSEDVQRELKEIQDMIEKIQTMEPPKEGLNEEQRETLREECRKNIKVVPQEFRSRRTVLVGLVGTLAACVLIALVVIQTEQRASRPIISATRAMHQDEDQALLSAKKSPSSAPESPAKPQVASAPPAPAAERVDDLASATANLPAADMVTKDSSYYRPEGQSGPALVNAERQELKSAGAPIAVAEKVEKSSSDQAANEMMFSTASVSAVSAPAPTGGATATIASGNVSGPSRYAYDFSESAPQTSAAPAQTFGSTSHYADSDKTPVLGDVPLAGRLFKEQATPQTRMIAPLDASNESYSPITENIFLAAKENPLSTFSIDVDTASYANVRRFLQAGQRPPLDAVRIEELVNYFPYAYPQPEGKSPFSVNVEVAQAAWDKSHLLARIALKGRDVLAEDRPASNLVFLIDVSGSMDEPNKLPLLKRSLAALVEHLRPEDRVAIVVYAGNSGLVLPSTLGKDKARILDALDRLQAGGSTNGGAGIKLAYKVAEENFITKGSNRVILCTDGDFNVGTTDEGDLVKLMEKERKSGVFISVLGFGTENLKDSRMSKLADKGDGNYSYIDSYSEGRKVLVEQMSGTLFTIAKDVKIQVEFNPAKVAGYRLIGYEKRLLAKEDFNNDKKDAGEIGSGHTVTALYEIVPAGQALPDEPSVDALKYQKPEAKTATPVVQEKTSDELFTVKLRYKAPDGDKSQLLEVPVTAEGKAFEKASEDFQFATAVAAFGMKLRGSQYVGDLSWPEIQKIARRSLGEDEGSYRAEFLTLVEKASKLNAPQTRDGE